MADYVVWFDRYTERDHARVGGKNASLGTMMAAGLPVPPGFAIAIEAYHTVRDHPDLRAEVSGLLATVDHTCRAISGMAALASTQRIVPTNSRTRSGTGKTFGSGRSGFLRRVRRH